MTEEIEYFFADFDHLLKAGRNPREALLETADDYAEVMYDIKPTKKEKKNIWFRLFDFLLSKQEKKMFDSLTATEVNIKDRKKIYPKRIRIKSISIEDSWRKEDDNCFLPCTHKAVHMETERGGKIVGVIHKSIAGALIPGYDYTIWWDRMNGYGFLEILDFEEV